MCISKLLRNMSWGSLPQGGKLTKLLLLPFLAVRRGRGGQGEMKVRVERSGR